MSQLAQYKWATIDAKPFCLLCLKVRNDKEALATHYLACHSIVDLEEHLGIKAAVLFSALQGERMGDAIEADQ